MRKRSFFNKLARVVAVLVLLVVVLGTVGYFTLPRTPWIFADAGVEVTIGTPVQYQVKAALWPKEYGLDTATDAARLAWLKIDPKTGLMTGDAPAPGDYTPQVTATNYFGTSRRPLLVRVKKSPVSMTSPLKVFAKVGEPFTFHVVTAPTLTTVTASGVPAGLTVAPDGTLRGTPRATGDSPVALKIVTPAGPLNTTLTVSVAKDVPPTLTAPAAVTCRVGDLVRVQLTAVPSNVTFGATGLPDGLSIDPASGAITGKPTTAATVDAVVWAKNGVGRTEQKIRLTVEKELAGPPKVSPATIDAFVGRDVRLQLQSTGTPARFVADGPLPDGLTLSPGGEITGRPTTLSGGVGRVHAVDAAGVAGPAAAVTLRVSINDDDVLTVADNAIDAIGQVEAAVRMATLGRKYAKWLQEFQQKLSDPSRSAERDSDQKSRDSYRQGMKRNEENLGPILNSIVRGSAVIRNAPRVVREAAMAKVNGISGRSLNFRRQFLDRVDELTSVEAVRKWVDGLEPPKD